MSIRQNTLSGSASAVLFSDAENSGQPYAEVHSVMTLDFELKQWKIAVPAVQDNYVKY